MSKVLKYRPLIALLLLALLLGVLLLISDPTIASKFKYHAF